MQNNEKTFQTAKASGRCNSSISAKTRLYRCHSSMSGFWISLPHLRTCRATDISEPAALPYCIVLHPQLQHHQTPTSNAILTSMSQVYEVYTLQRWPLQTASKLRGFDRRWLTKGQHSVLSTVQEGHL